MSKALQKCKYRKFLNKKGHHSTAFIYVDGAVDVYGKMVYSGTTMTLSDCSRQVRLEFDCENKREYLNVKRKISLIRQGLDEVESLTDRFAKEKGYK